MEETSRRAFIKNSLSTLLTFSLLETLFRGDLFAETVKPITKKWLREVEQISKELRGQKIAQVVWQQKIEELFSRVDLPDLLRFIDFDRLTKNIEFPDDHANIKDPHFPKIEGMPERMAFIGRIFALSKGRAVVPHGHQNMVSGHIIIKGQMHVRHFERVRDEAEHLIIKPSIDRMSNVGEATTISDERDNIHWLKAISDSAFTFDFVVADLDPQYPTKLVFLDPDGGERLSDGLIRARQIEHEQAYKLYGKS